MSCRKQRSPSSATTGPPDAAATPSTVDTKPSMPFTPRFARTRTPSAGAANALDVAHRHARRDDQRRAVGQRGDDVACDPPLERLVPAVEQAVDRAPSASLGAGATVEPLRSCRPGRRSASATAASSALGVDRETLAAPRRGIEPRAVGIDEPLRHRPGRATRRGLARERRADAQHEVGAVRAGERVARAAARRRSRSRPGRTAAPRAGRRAPASRPPRRSARTVVGCDVRAPARDEHARAARRATGVGDAAPPAVVGHAPRAVDARPRPAVGPTGRVDERRAGRHERLAERQVEVHRARRAGRVASATAARRDRAPVRRPTPGTVLGRRRDRRTSAPRRRRAPRWSMVWPAPVSRSSGGRSAVHTISGTRAWCASSTAGWKLAAAVPDVHEHDRGRPDAWRRRARRTPPSARRGARAPGSRSSRASASASGVERDPGASARVRRHRPRAHSSTSARAKRGVASRRRRHARIAPMRLRAGARVHARPSGPGTPVEARLPRDWDVQALEVPDGLDFVATADTLGLRGGTGTLGRVLDGRPAVPAARARPTRARRAARPRQRVAGHRPRERAADAARGRRAARAGRRA